MRHRLRPGQAAFQVIDGELAGRKFIPQVVYENIPVLEAWRFCEVKEKQPAKTEKKAREKARERKQ